MSTIIGTGIGVQDFYSKAKVCESVYHTTSDPIYKKQIPNLSKPIKVVK